MNALNTFGRYSADPIDKGRGLSVRQGHQWKFKFENGYGASVIDDGYGRNEGLYELAVLGPDGAIAYDTPITDDVLGYLTDEQVGEALARIEALLLGDISERDGEAAR